MVRVTELVSTIESKDDLARFVGEPREDLVQHPNDWQNLTLDHYLESLSAWLVDMKDASSDGVEPLPDDTSWRTLAEVLLAGKYYE